MKNNKVAWIIGVLIVALIALLIIQIIMDNKRKNDLTAAQDTAEDIAEAIDVGNSQQVTATGELGTSTPANGLLTKDLVIGTGTTAVSGKTVTVNYTGTFEDGRVFDSSVGRQPFTFVLGSGMVIKGWDIGVAGMKVGGKRSLVIPAELGYGAQGRGTIPGGATLLFDVELLDVR